MERNGTPNKKYRKNPETYLNQEHWENKIEFHIDDQECEAEY